MSDEPMKPDMEARAKWVSERYWDALAARPLQDAGIVKRDLEALWDHRWKNGAL